MKENLTDVARLDGKMQYICYSKITLHQICLPHILVSLNDQTPIKGKRAMLQKRNAAVYIMHRTLNKFSVAFFLPFWVKDVLEKWKKWLWIAPQTCNALENSTNIFVLNKLETKYPVPQSIKCNMVLLYLLYTYTYYYNMVTFVSCIYISSKIKKGLVDYHNVSWQVYAVCRGVNVGLPMAMESQVHHMWILTNLVLKESHSFSWKEIFITLLDGERKILIEHLQNALLCSRREQKHEITFDEVLKKF